MDKIKIIKIFSKVAIQEAERLAIETIGMILDKFKDRQNQTETNEKSNE